MANVSTAGGGAGFDLSTYSGREAARQAGYYVGQNQNGSYYMEYGYQGGQANQPMQQASQTSYPNQPAGYSTRANDGQTFSQQSTPTQQAFQAAYGNNAAAAWVAQHNQAIAGQTSQPSTTQRPSSAQIQTPATGQYQSNIAALQQAQNAASQAAAARFAQQQKVDQQNFQLQQDRLKLEQQQLQLTRQQAQQDMQLARNADARAQAQLKLAQADQQLRQNQFEQAKVEFDKNLSQRQFEFNQNLAFQREQLGEQASEFKQAQYTNLATGLLQGAAQLRGPRDWTQYAQFLGGGRNLQEQLFGGGANAAFGGERGASPAIQVGDVMGALGFTQGGGPAPSTQFGTVPLPHQVSPGQWDSMSQNSRDLVLGLAQGGNTAQGVYTPEDYERILNASRPVGTASRSTQSSFSAPAGAF